MKMALTPIMNQMNVVGIVSIPDMITGQILSGSDPSQVCGHPR
jgi:putative ABC transport system permease protein